ncbi:MAG TPA: GGDEF domain-containing protein [Geobacteraceae bacterium]
MLIAIAKRATIFAVPAVVLIAAAVVLPRIATLPPARQELATVAPYLVAALGMFLAVHFHRGRPFYVLLILTFFYWSARTLQGSGMTGLAAQGDFLALSLLLPANITLFAFIRERGIFTLAGRLRFAFLVGQGIAAFWLFRVHFADVQPLVTRKFLAISVLDGLAVPQSALTVTVICFLLLGVLAVRRQSPIDSGFLGTLVALFVACNWLTTPDTVTAFCSAGALIMTFSVLQDSYNMAFRDDLTGLPSRRALNESLHGLGRRYAIAMLDVDHFKKFNDTYGHDVGDQVLKMVARKMMGVRGGGKPFRYGGEEFTVIFPRRQAVDAIPHLEELRKTIAEYRMFIRSAERPKDGRQGKVNRGSGGDGTYVSVTVSIGVSEIGEGQTTPAEVIKAADKALYRAKNKGRNQVCK